MINLDNCNLDLMDITYNVDSEIFKKFVAPHYNPSDEPVAICVGATSPDEGTVLKEFHKQEYGKDVKIAACNIRDSPGPLFYRLNPYDYLMFNIFQGDARTSYPYLSALEEFNALKEGKGFDLAYIRNPDLVSLSDWEAIFLSTVENLSNEGIAITLIREDDTQKYSRLLRLLNDRRVVPVFSGETGMSFLEDSESDFLIENFHHTLGIFKKPEGFR